MHRSIDATLPAEPAKVYAALHSLESYPAWLDIVTAVAAAPPAPGDDDAAWWVTLRAKVGPFARSKRLRMVRRVADEPRRLRFERHEIDGRHHAPWILDVHIDPDGPGSTLHVDLRYEGGLWSAPLDAVLGSQVDAAVPKLMRLIG